MRTTLRLHGPGKVTIPRHIREALDVDAGDLVEIEVCSIERQDRRKEQSLGGSSANSTRQTRLYDYNTIVENNGGET
jgi:bifunctional DNA-binding transcriptional regulator/antitoxin component of YhaV-PrlF toxin-antitoxin module